MKILPSQSVCRAQRDMTSALYSQDLTCPICYTIFTDSVNLLCGHSFCRECIITDVESSQHHCPECETAVPSEGEWLPTIHILKGLAEKAKEAEQVKKEKEKAEVAELCLEHVEKLKLFCVTDQQLACIICRDGDRHEGHKFKPIKEAAASVRQKLEKGMKSLRGDILATESLANTQSDEITKNKEKSQQLMTQIFRQFEEMHQFLRKREDEIKNELKHKEEDAAEKMRERLNAIETALSDRRELEGKLTSVLEIEDSARLLKSWTECNSRMSPEHVFRPKANDLKVVNTSISLEPYESHLQFFIWKEMLQVIQPRAELLSLKSNSTDITVSDDGRSLFCTPESNQAPIDYSSDFDYNTESYQNTAFSQGMFGSSRPQLFGSTTGSDQHTAFSQGMFGSSKPQLFGSTTGSDQNTAFSQGMFGSSKPQLFGSTTGSDQNTAFSQGMFGSSKPQLFGSTTGSDQNTAFSQGMFGSSKPQLFGSTTGSDQHTAFSQGMFGSSKPQLFGSTTGSVQHTAFSQGMFGSSKPQLFGSTTGSDQNTAFSQGMFGSSKPQLFGSTTGSDQNTAFSQGMFGSSKPQLFGSTTGSDQNTAFSQGMFGSSKPQLFGSTTGSDQHTAFSQGMFGSSKPQLFGSTTGSVQNTAFSQGMFGSGKPQLFGSTTGSVQHTASSSTKKHVFSVNEFTSGQHYWEIEVGHRDYWELGIKDNFLKYDGEKYVTCHPDKTTELVFGDRPRKIGIYLNCASKTLSFYDADNMTRIHAMSSPLMSMPLSAYFNIRVRAPDPNPLTVCWY